MWSFESQSRVKVKVVKWCRKKWFDHNQMYIYHKQCEILQKNHRNSSNIQFQWFPIEKGRKLCKRKRWNGWSKKMIELETTTFSEPPGRQLSDGKPWIPQKNVPIWEKSVCVCVVLVPFGPFPQRINGKSLKLNVWAVLVIFLARFHIVCDRYTSDYDHFTFSDTIWPLLLSPDVGTQMITLAETAS